MQQEIWVGPSIQRRFEMNWDQIEGKWKQSMGKIKAKWGKLTDDDLTTINGKKEQLVGKIQERYGIAKDAAEKQVDEFTRSYTSDDSAKAAKSSWMNPQHSERGMRWQDTGRLLAKAWRALCTEKSVGHFARAKEVKEAKWPAGNKRLP
jgi:uncharacterized protein YjbJ (UPF0337 family)